MDKKIGFALLRVSTPEQSLDSQEASLLKIAEEKKYKIPEKYIFREKKTGYDELGVDRQSIIDLRNAIALIGESAVKWPPHSAPNWPPNTPSFIDTKNAG